MIKSMTGFGSARGISNGVPFSVEIRSVNSRYFDYHYKGCETSLRIEETIRRKVQKVCHRGRVEVTLQIDKNGIVGNEMMVLDRKKYEAYQSILKTIHNDYGIEINISSMVDLKDLLVTNEKLEVDEEAVSEAVDKSLKELEEMREQEGKKLLQDFRERLVTLFTNIDNIEEIQQESVSYNKDKYIAKISEMMRDIPDDDSRIIQEAAILADKLDISEEIVRCRSHFDQFKLFLNADKPAGKRLQFLLQEIVREINTIGSKTNQLEISRIVIELKDDVEKLREQVQNVL